jgi:4'-phosphopantetheinyl transferase
MAPINSRPVLGDTGIDLWYVPTPEIEYHSLFERWGHWLDPSELERLQNHKISKGQSVFFLTRVALRYLLSCYFPDIKPAAWRFARTHEGRPFVSGPQHDAPLFNLSHAANMLVFAFSNAGQPGVDIEKSSRQLPVLEMAQRYFSAQETEVLRGLSGRAQNDYFLMLWTLKEASVKASGKGLAKGIRDYSFELGSSSSGSSTSKTFISSASPKKEGYELSFHRAGDALADSSRWRLWSARHNDYQLALALCTPVAQNTKECVVTPRQLCWPNQHELLSWHADLIYE